MPLSRILLLLAFSLIQASSAGAEPRPDAEAMIKDCGDRHIATAGPTNTETRESFVDYFLCLEEAIIGQFTYFDDNLKPPHDPNDKRSTAEIVRQQLVDLRTPIQSLNWWLYNAHPGCERSPCGTIYFSFHLIANSKVLERILKDVVAQRRRHDF